MLVFYLQLTQYESRGKYFLFINGGICKEIPY